MKARLAILLACLVLLTSAFGSTALGWNRLKPGMTPAEVSAAIGNPLLRSEGRGFILWIYDHQSEVIFHGGTVMGWTAPAPTSPNNLPSQ